VWDGSNLPTQSNMDTALPYNETAAQIWSLGSNVGIASTILTFPSNSELLVPLLLYSTVTILIPCITIVIIV
jgi:hypothetical protein